MQPIDALRLQRGVEHLHKRGPREMAQFLTELAGRIGGMPAALALLNEYEQRPTPALLRTAIARRAPRRTMREVTA